MNSKSLPMLLWGTLYLNISIILSHICWQTGDPRLIFTPKGLGLSWMLLLYQIMITITCWHRPFQIPSFKKNQPLMAPVPTLFGMCCKPMNPSLWSDQEEQAGLLIKEPDHKEKRWKMLTGSSRYLPLTYGSQWWSLWHSVYPDGG